MIKNINMTELENALAVVKNATDLLIEIAEEREFSLNAYTHSNERQKLCDRVQSRDVVELIAFLDVVKKGDFDIRRDMKYVDNRESQILKRIEMKAESLR